jgi:hypothetical protein
MTVVVVVVVIILAGIFAVVVVRSVHFGHMTKIYNREA